MAIVLEGVGPAGFGVSVRLKQTLHRYSLWWALGFSLLLHAALIVWRFADPVGFNRVFEDTSLEVVLVNARSDASPERAQVIAQVRLAGGGGQSAPNARSRSPLPPSDSHESGTDIAAMQRQIQALELEQIRLISQLQQALSQVPNEPAGQNAHVAERQSQPERQRQWIRQLAQIEKNISKAQNGPRTRYISPATQEAVYALYYDKLRRTIETLGTLNFPQVNGQKLYGQLTMVITVNARGQLLATEVALGSGQPLLDQRALAIVRSAAPFDAFSTSMQRQADQLVVVTRFQFSKEGALDIRMLTPHKQPP